MSKIFNWQHDDIIKTRHWRQLINRRLTIAVVFGSLPDGQTSSVN